MEKTSKVTRVTGNGSWDSQYGKMYKFEIEFENGDIGNYNSKILEQKSFKENDTCTYDITTKEVNGVKYHTIKPVKQAFVPQSSKASEPETGKKIARMSVLKCVTDLVVSGHIKFDVLFEYAKLFEAYVELGVNPFGEIYAQEEVKKIKAQDPRTHDLPF
jgi:hypothetical protein